MIKLIAAIDSKYGMADEHGIPWQGKLPTDIAFFRSSTIHNDVLMGAVTYSEFQKPLSDRHNYVLTHEEKIREGFEAVHELPEFLKTHPDIWVIGGAEVFSQTIGVADELYITRVEGDFHCTKFFPAFESHFELAEKSENHVENGIKFHFEVWRKVTMR